MRVATYFGWAMLAAACSSSTTNEAPESSGGEAGTGGSTTGGTSSGGTGGTGQSGSGGTSAGGSAGSDAALGGTAGSDAALGGTAGSDAALDGTAGTDASLGGAAGTDASLGGAGGTGGASGTGSTGSGGTAGSDAGDAAADGAPADASVDVAVEASDGAPQSDADTDASADASGADAGDAAIDAPLADAGPCAAGVGGGDGTAHYPRWKIGGVARPDSEFTASADVALDHVTCLMWQRAANVPTDWTSAKSSCEASTLDGYTDWRLPTRAELISLTDFTRIIPALNPTVFPGVSNVTSAGARFWSATVLSTDSAKRWSVLHGSVGQITYLAATDPHAYRCVRGTGAPTGTRFDTTTAGVVKDNETSLIWEGAPLNQDFTLAQATAYCAALGTGGWSDWRLPTIRELATLPDPLMAVPALPAYFNPLSAWYWSGTPAYAANPPQNWAVQMGLGFSQPDTYLSPRVRCVR